MTPAFSIEDLTFRYPGQEAAATEPLMIISSMSASVLLNCGVEPCAKGRAPWRRRA